MARRRYPGRLPAAAAGALGLLVAGCEDDSPPREPRGPVVLTCSPLPYAAISSVTPLGNLNPPAHTFPTRHIYFYLLGVAPVEVRAVASGRVRAVFFNPGSGDYRIDFQHTDTFVTYLDHVADPPPEVRAGVWVEAGDLVGYGRPRVSAVDLGVFDYERTGAFIVPQRYHEYDVHCTDPFAAFSPDIREALLAFNPRRGGGRVHYDVDGTLAGNWFHASLPVPGSASSAFGAGHLAFVYDPIEPDRILISCGGTLATAPFVRGVVGNAPDPATVTPAVGTVKFPLQGPRPVVLLVRMTDRRRLRAEVFADQTPETVADFTSAAQTYVR